MTTAVRKSATRNDDREGLSVRMYEQIGFQDPEAPPPASSRELSHEILDWGHACLNAQMMADLAVESLGEAFTGCIWVIEKVTDEVHHTFNNLELEVRSGRLDGLQALLRDELRLLRNARGVLRHVLREDCSSEDHLMFALDLGYISLDYAVKRMERVLSAVDVEQLG